LATVVETLSAPGLREGDEARRRLNAVGKKLYRYCPFSELGAESNQLPAAGPTQTHHVPRASGSQYAGNHSRGMTAKAIIEATLVPGTKSVFFLGCFEKRVTLYAQQVRALNLVDAILESQVGRRAR
jgi:hypothetical protein